MVILWFYVEGVKEDTTNSLVRMVVCRWFNFSLRVERGEWVDGWRGELVGARRRDPSKQKTISIGLWREAREWFNKLVNCLLIGLVFCSLWYYYYCHSPPGHVRTRQYWLHLLLMDFSDAIFIFIYRKGSPSELCRVQSQSSPCPEGKNTTIRVNW